VEERKGLEGEREVAEGDYRAPHEDAPVLAEETVGDDASEDRGQPGAARVRSVDRGRVFVAHPEAARGRRRHHVEDEEGPHPVVAEALPHLGEEEGGEASGVAGPARGLAHEAPFDRAGLCRKNAGAALTFRDDHLFFANPLRRTYGSPDRAPPIRRAPG